MASWDFCNTCNSGNHCCRHDRCDCKPVKSAIESFSVSELKAELKRKKTYDAAYLKAETARMRRDTLKEIQTLEAQLKTLKAKVKK